MNPFYKFTFYFSFALTLIGCSNKKDENTTEVATTEDSNVVLLSEAQLKTANIATTTLSKSAMGGRLIAYGNTFLPPENITTIAATYGGKIQSLPVVEGQYIATGQVVATLENPDYIDLQQDYLLTQTRLKLSAQDYERQRELNQHKANSDKVYQQAESDWKTQKIMLQSLGEKLKLLGINPANLTEKSMARRIAIRSTASGYVSSIYVNTGKYISSSENMMDIIQTSQPLLRLKIYEKDLSKINIGMPLKAYRVSDTNKEFSCFVKNINPMVNADGSADVICRFASTQKSIFQNTNMIAQIELSNASVNSLPEEAIVFYEGNNYIFVEEKNKQYRMMPLMIGNRLGASVEVLNPTDFADKKIVTKGAYTLLMSLKNKEE